MKIGIPKEIKPQEGRVSALPEQVGQLVRAGHALYVENSAGILSGFDDGAYRDAGATMLSDGAEIFETARLIVKVKEILPPEFASLRKDHILLTNIHAANDKVQLDRLLEVGLIAIAAEDTHQFGSPNCPLAGEVGAFEAVRLSLAPYGGTGRHFMGHFGTQAAKAVVIGLGHVGSGALRTLLALGVDVVGLDISAGARKQAMLDWHGRNFRADHVDNLKDHLGDADMIINCVMWPKDRNDHLINRAMLKQMKPTAIIVDISCDEAGAIETSRPTNWRDPVYEVGGIRHFCVDNIPGAVPAAASAGYAVAIMPHILEIAEYGPLEACRRNPFLGRGLTCANGVLTLEEAAKVQSRPYVPTSELLAET